MKAYINDGTRGGWRQYFDSQGTEWRREDADCFWFFFKKIGDAFVFEGSILQWKKRESIKAVHERFTDIMYKNSMCNDYTEVE